MKLKVLLPVLLISSISFTGIGSTIFVMKSQSNPQGQVSSGNTSEDKVQLTEKQKEVLAVKEKLFENLGSSNLKVDNLDVTADNLLGQNKQLNLNFKGSLDYKAFITSHKNNDESDDIAAKFDGKVNLRVLDNNDGAQYPIQLDENIDLHSRGTGKLYISWYGQNYTASGKIISDVLNFVPTIGTLTGKDLSNVTLIADNIKDIDILSLLPIAINVLGSMSTDTDLNQTPVDGTYTFNLNVSEDLASKVGMNQSINLALKCDSQGLLTGIELSDITVNDAVLKFNAMTSMSVTESYVDGEVDDEAYTNNLDCTTNLLTTVTSLVNEKKFASDYYIQINEYKNGLSNAHHKFEGNITADLTDATAINEGAKYALSINENESFGNHINVKYEDKKTYFKVNNLINGYLDDTTIDGIVSDITNTVDSSSADDAQEATETVNEILQNSKIYDIYNGNWSAYKDIIKSLKIESEVLTLTVSAKDLLDYLPDADFTINMDLSDGKLNSVSILNLPFRELTKTDGYSYLDTIDFSLALTDFDSVKFDFGNLEQYTSFKVITPLYQTIAKIVGDKQVGVDYYVSYIKNDDQANALNLYGALNADFNKLTSLDTSAMTSVDSAISTIKGEDLGLYSLEAHTSVNGVEHNVNMTYQDKGLYLDYQGASETSRTRMSLTQGTIFNLYDVVNGLIKKDTGDVDLYDEMNTMLDNLLDITDGNIWSILKGSMIKNLEKYVTVSNGTGDDLVVTLDTGLFSYDGMLTVTLDKNSHDLLSVSASYLNEEKDTIAFSIDFTDYIDPTIDNEEITNYYKQMDTSVQAIINIINGLSGSAKVDGTLASPSEA